MVSSVPALLAVVDRSEFRERLHAAINGAGRIRNFGAYFWTSVREQRAVLSFWFGPIGEYRLRMDGRRVVKDGNMLKDMQAEIEAAEPVAGAHVRFRPDAGDPRYAMYRRAGVAERLSLATRDGDRGLFSFYLRSAADGPISEAEERRFAEILPLAHHVLQIRHKIAGSDAARMSSAATVHRLRDMGVSDFRNLSLREVQVCDALLRGLSVAGTAIELGIAETSVRTLRRRAYRKLQVSSAGELMALLLEAS